MINPRIEQLMNEQIKHEFSSAYLYLAFGAHFASKGMKGFESWMKKQAAEEQVHAMKFFDFLIDRDGKITLQAIDQPVVKAETPLQFFTEALKHERLVTGLINKIYAAAVEEKDYASQTFLHWFIDEQVEEEANATAVIDLLKLIGESGEGLLMLDHQLGER